jgi:GntR family transcriptional regulator
MAQVVRSGPAKVPAPADIAARLGIAEGELCFRTTYEFLADGRPVQLSASWEPYDLTAGTLVVLPEGGPHAGAGVVNRMAAIGVTVSRAVEQPEPRQATAEEASLLGIQKAALVTHIRRTYYSDQGRPVETADIVVPAAHCEIVYEIPINRQPTRPLRSVADPAGYATRGRTPRRSTASACVCRRC